MSVSFKEQMQRDIDNVFLNVDEFAEMHRIEGKDIPVVIDRDAFVKLRQGQLLGMVEADMLIFGKVTDLPPEKAPGSLLNVDGKECIVEAWVINNGMAEIALRQNRMA